MEEERSRPDSDESITEIGSSSTGLSLKASRARGHVLRKALFSPPQAMARDRPS
ncbi:MAG: hypothetical protein IPH86_06370 [bacterium]|nr:hypothetical protein [bacterium]